MSNIQEAVKQAREAAATMANSEPHRASNVVLDHRAASMRAFTKPTMAGIQAARGILGQSVNWLKVDVHGLTIGKDKKLFDNILVDLDTTEEKGFMVKHTFRFGNPPTYLSTYDGIACDKGGSWGAAVAKARMVDPEIQPFHAADIRITLSEEVTMKDGKTKLTLGSVLGHTTSKTNFYEWSNFYEELAKADLIGQTVKVKLGWKEMTSPNVAKPWAVVTFELAQ